MNKTNNFLNMDERNKIIAYKIITIMYLITIFLLQLVVIYRQFALGQEINEFEDIAIIMTANSLFLISALLFFGAIQVRNLQVKQLLFIYFILVILGSLFTYAKYNIFRSPGLSHAQLFDKFIIIASILAIILGFLVLFSFLGNKRTEKELE